MHILYCCSPFRKQKGNCMTVDFVVVTTDNYTSRNPYSRQGIFHSALLKKTFPSSVLWAEEMQWLHLHCRLSLGVTLNPSSFPDTSCHVISVLPIKPGNMNKLVWGDLPERLFLLFHFKSHLPTLLLLGRYSHVNAKSVVVAQGKTLLSYHA